MSFSNETIIPLRADKPHIVFIKGRWRVSPLVKPYHKYHTLWGCAHLYVNKRNGEKSC